MGWASGSQLAEQIFKRLKKIVPKGDHKIVAQILYEEFSNEDADDWDYGKGTVWRLGAPKEEVEAYDRGE